MANSFQLDIVTPTKVINEGAVEYLRAPSLDGLFGVEAGHAPAIIGLGIGEIKVNKGTEVVYYSTGGGYDDSRQEGVMLIVESVEKATEIDADRAKEALDRAMKKLGDEKFDTSQARESLDRAKNRLKIAYRNK